MKRSSLNLFIIIFVLVSSMKCYAQVSGNEQSNNAGWLSFGARSTLSLFDGDGAGIGSGGQFRIQPSNKVNTDWFGDYITINIKDKVRSEYYHVGWSVLYYPFQKNTINLMQPFFLAGHCFDYNKKSLMTQPQSSKDRWGSAVQAGIGTHFNLSTQFDLTVMCQYMIHLTRQLEVKESNNEISIVSGKGNLLEGHLLTTLSVNCKILRLWKK